MRSARLLSVFLLASCGDAAPTRPCDRIGLLCSDDQTALALDLTATRGATADLDGDGALDLVTAAPSGSLSIAWGAADPTTRDYRLFPGGVPDVKLGDIDGDGDIDLVFLTSEPSALRVLLNDGERRLSDGPTLPLAGHANGLWLGRLDADASLDAAVASTGEGTITVITDGLTRATPIAVGHDLVAIDVGDFNGDDRLDLVAVDRGDAAFHLLLASGDAFTAPRRVATGLAPQYLQPIDFDGDGHTDLLTHGKGPEIWLHQGDGAGNFAPARALLVQDAASQGFGAHRDEQGGRWLLTFNDARLIASQLDPTDQLVRRVVGRSFDGADSLTMDRGAPLTQSTAGATRHSLASAYVFTELWNGPVDHLPRPPLYADLDLDGAPELTTLGNEFVVVHHQRPDGSWSELSRLELPRSMGIAVGAAAITAADVTGDGLPDLVLGEYESSVRVAIGAGDGSFTLGEPSPIGFVAEHLHAPAPATGPAAVIAGATRFLDAGAVSLRFDAAGVVSEQTQLVAAGDLISLTSIDLDADADADALALVRDQDNALSLYIFPASGPGWGPPRARSLSALLPDVNLGGPTALALADIDLDGSIDGVLGAELGTIRLPDLGADPPPPPIFTATTEIPWSEVAALADIDDDPGLDLALCSSYFLEVVRALADEFRPEPPLAVSAHACALHVDPATRRVTAATLSNRGLSVLAPAVAPTLADDARFSGGPAALQQLATGDMDADGFTDIVVVADVSRDHSFAVLWGSDGPPRRATWQHTSDTGTIVLAALDDRPGDELVIASTRGTADIWSHVDGALQLVASADPDDAPSALAVGVQRRGDGPADLILFGRTGQDRWAAAALPLTARGAFLDPEASIPLATGTRDTDLPTMTLADLDGDTLDDIAVFAGESQPIAVLWGDTKRSNAVQILDTTDLHVHSLTTADLDGDGAPELILGSSAGVQSIAFHGRTADPPIVRIENPATSLLLIADLEADGRPDILRADDHSLNITLRAPATADAHAQLSLDPPWQQLRAAHLDADDILDLVGIQNGALVTRLSAPEQVETP